MSTSGNVAVLINGNKMLAKHFRHKVLEEVLGKGEGEGEAEGEGEGYCQRNI